MTKQTVMAGDMLFLPEEIIGNILMRLPVKTLIRYRCVSKHWRNLIKSPSFISEHLHQSTHKNPCLLFRRNGIWLLDCKMQLHQLDNPPLADSSSLNTYKIVGSSNGLLCVDVDPDCTLSPSLFLWNPATREVRHLPPNTKVPPLPSYSILRKEFGFSPIDNDYKIVIIYLDSAYEVLHVGAFSLRSGSWKEVEFGIKNDLVFKDSLTVNGTMFWFGSEWKQGTTDTFQIVIVSFDLVNEVFTLIIPDSPLSVSSRFAVYENKLAIISSNHLWVMEDRAGASWFKKFIISGSQFLRPAAIWMNQIVQKGAIVGGNKHVKLCDRQKITLLNISTNELKTIDMSKCGDGKRGGFNYAENLVPI